MPMAGVFDIDANDGSSGHGEGRSEALSVSAAMAQAKQSLESVVVRIIGEVSEVSVKPGYKAAYFTVKDSSASLPCMMWNNRYRASGIDLAVGQLVEITGRFTLYAAKGRMNFDVFSIALAGEGDLRLKVANIAKRLQTEGLTDASHKLPLPEFPERIGLITSPRSAAVHDVLRTLRRRFPVAVVSLAGVAVEGAQAAEGIVEGMRAVYRSHPDVILIVRGGGSFEDLMPFNDEGLARAIAACPIPVVTGIGHEVDTTIADMVSDFRASTPTAAAEAVSPSREALEEMLSSRQSVLYTAMQHGIDRCASRVERFESRPLFKDPMLMFAADAQTLDVASDRLARALPAHVGKNRMEADAMGERFKRALPTQVARAKLDIEAMSSRYLRVGSMISDRHAHQMSQMASRLADLSPVNTLARGYAIARNEQGRIVRHVDEAPLGSMVEINVADGIIDCEVKGSRTGKDLSWKKN